MSSASPELAGRKTRTFARCHIKCWAKTREEQRWTASERGRRELRMQKAPRTRHVRRLMTKQGRRILWVPKPSLHVSTSRRRVRGRSDLCNRGVTSSRPCCQQYLFKRKLKSSLSSSLHQHNSVLLNARQFRRIALT